MLQFNILKFKSLIYAFSILLLANTSFALSPIIDTPQQTKILMFGDSLTQGYGLSKEDGLVPQLQEWLHKNNSSIILVNGGVSGDTTAGGLSRIEWSLLPDITGVVVTLGGNDMLRGINPDNTKNNLEEIVKIITERGLDLVIIGLESPMNYGENYKREFDSIYPVLAEKYNAIYLDNFFKPLLKVTNYKYIPMEYMQSDGIHPNKEGVSLIVDHIGPTILKLEQY